jgi:hypothetical protein
MPASVKSPRLRPTPHARRTTIRDREHAQELARGIAIGDLLRNGGSVRGFADWLFVHRRTFNGANPAQQVSVYANRCKEAAKRGANYDRQCRDQADAKERIHEHVRTEFDACLAAVKAYWTETPVGPDMTLAIAELGLGRGHQFSVAPQLAAEQDAVPAWISEWLLELFERLGGTDESLDELEWMSETREVNFEQDADARDAELMDIRQGIFEGQPPSERDFVSVALCVRHLSRLRRVRTTLRALLTRAMMVERIEAVAPSNESSREPVRRRREV